MQSQFQCSCTKLSFAAVIDGDLCVSASLKGINGFRKVAHVNVGKCYRQNNDIVSFLSEVNKADPLLATVSACQTKCRFQSKAEFSSSDRSASDVLNQLLSVLFENDQLAFCRVDICEFEDSSSLNDIPSSSSKFTKSYDGLLQVIGKSSAILYIDINNVNGPTQQKRRERPISAAADDTPTETKTFAKRVTPNSGLSIGTPTAVRRSSTATSEDISLGMLNDCEADLDSVGSGSTANHPTLHSLCQRYLRPERRSRGGAPTTPVDRAVNNNVSSTESLAAGARRIASTLTGGVGGLQRSASLSQLGAITTTVAAATRQPSLDSRDTATLAGSTTLRNPKKSVVPTPKTTPPLASSSSGTAAPSGLNNNNINSNKSRLLSRGEIQRKALPGQNLSVIVSGASAVVAVAAPSVSESVAAAAEHKRRRDHHIRGELRRLNSSPSIQMLDLSQQSTLTGGSVVSYRSDSSVDSNAAARGGGGARGGYESSDGDRDTLVDTGSESEVNSYCTSSSRRPYSGGGGIAMTPTVLDGFKSGVMRHSHAAYYEDKTPQHGTNAGNSSSNSCSSGEGNRLLPSFDEQSLQTPVRGGVMGGVPIVNGALGSNSTPVGGSGGGCGGIALLNSRDMAFLNEMQPDTSFELEAAADEEEEQIAGKDKDRYYSEDADFDRTGGYFQRESDDFQLTECNLERFNEEDMLEYSKSSFSRQFASGKNKSSNFTSGDTSQSTAVPAVAPPMIRKSKSFSSAPAVLLSQIGSPALSDGGRRVITAGYQSDEASNLFPDLTGSGSRQTNSRLPDDSLAYSRSNANAATAAGSLGRQQLLLSQSPQCIGSGSSNSNRNGVVGGGLFGFVTKAPTLGEMSGNKHHQQQQQHLLSPIAASPTSESHARLFDQVSVGTPVITSAAALAASGGDERELLEQEQHQQMVASLSEENTQETILMVDIDSVLAGSEGTAEQHHCNPRISEDTQQQHSFEMKPPIGKHQRSTTENSRTSDEHSHLTAASASSSKTAATTSSLEASRSAMPTTTAAASTAAAAGGGASSAGVSIAPRQVDARLKVYEAALNRLPSDLFVLLGDCILWQKVFPIDCALQLTSHLLSLNQESLKKYYSHLEKTQKAKKGKKETKPAKPGKAEKLVTGALSRSALLDGVMCYLVKMLSKLLEERMGTFVDGIKAYGACAVLLAVLQTQYFAEVLRAKGSIDALGKLKSFRKFAQSFEVGLDKSLLSFGSWCLSPEDRMWIVSIKSLNNTITGAAANATTAGSTTTALAAVAGVLGNEKERKRRNKSEEKTLLEAASSATEEIGGPSRFQLLIDFLITQFGKSDDLAALFALIKDSVRSRDYNVQIQESPIKAPRGRPASDAAAAVAAASSSAGDAIIDPDPSELSRLFPDEISGSIDIVSIPNSSAEHSKASFELENPTVPQLLGPLAGATTAAVTAAAASHVAAVDGKTGFAVPKPVEKPLSTILTKKKTVVNSRVSMGQSKTVSVSVRDLRQQQQQQVIRRASTLPDASSLRSPPRTTSKLSSGSPDEVMNTPFSPGASGTLGKSARRRVEDTPIDQQGAAGGGGIHSSSCSSSKRPKLMRTTPLFGDMLNSPVLSVTTSPVLSSGKGIIADTPVFAGRSSSQPVEPLINRTSSSNALEKRSLSQFTPSSSSSSALMGFSLSGETSDSEGEELSQRSVSRVVTITRSGEGSRAPSPEPNSSSAGAVPLLNAFSMESPRPTLPPTAKRSRSLSDGDASSRFSANSSIDPVAVESSGVMSTPVPLVPKSLRRTVQRGIAESPLKDSPMAASPDAGVVTTPTAVSATRSGSIFRSPPLTAPPPESLNSPSSLAQMTTPVISILAAEGIDQQLFLTQTSPLIPSEQLSEQSSILKAPKKKARSPDFSENYLTASGSKVKSLSQPVQSSTSSSSSSAAVKPPIGRKGRK